MNQKTKLADASCPVHKWDVYNPSLEDLLVEEGAEDE